MLQDSTAKLDSTTAQYDICKEHLKHAREMMLTERYNKDKVSEKLDVAEKRIGEPLTSCMLNSY